MSTQVIKNVEEDNEDDLPCLFDMPRSFSLGALGNTTKTTNTTEEGGVKTLLDIIKQDTPPSKHIPKLSLLSTKYQDGIDAPRKLKLVRQQAIHAPAVDFKSDPVEEVVDMYENPIVKREILPGWRIVDALTDGIVIGMVVFPWPLWAAIFLVLGMRVPMITRACGKHD